MDYLKIGAVLEKRAKDNLSLPSLGKARILPHVYGRKDLGATAGAILDILSIEELCIWLRAPEGLDICFYPGEFEILERT